MTGPRTCFCGDLPGTRFYWAGLKPGVLGASLALELALSLVLQGQAWSLRSLAVCPCVGLGLELGYMAADLAPKFTGAGLGLGSPVK